MATSNFGRNLRALRDKRGMTQERLAQLIDASPITVSKWETTGRKPRSQEVIRAICQALLCSEQELMGYMDGFYATEHGLYPPKSGDSSYGSFAPVVGCIAAGEPREAIEDVSESHWVNPDVLDEFPGGYFLRVNGDSMDKVLPDGSFAYIHPCDVKSGDIAAVKVNGDDATIKRVKMIDGVVILEPESNNPKYRRRVIDETDPDAPEVRLLGRVVWADIRYA